MRDAGGQSESVKFRRRSVPPVENPATYGGRDGKDRFDVQNYRVCVKRRFRLDVKRGRRANDRKRNRTGGDDCFRRQVDGFDRNRSIAGRVGIVVRKDDGRIFAFDKDAVSIIEPKRIHSRTGRRRVELRFHKERIALTRRIGVAIERNAVDGACFRIDRHAFRRRAGIVPVVPVSYCKISNVVACFLFFVRYKY